LIDEYPYYNPDLIHVNGFSAIMPLERGGVKTTIDTD
jgi:hypothetical protein